MQPVLKHSNVQYDLDNTFGLECAKYIIPATLLIWRAHLCRRPVARRPGGRPGAGGEYHSLEAFNCVPSD